MRPTPEPTMQFALSEEERQLEESAARFIRERYGFDHWRETARHRQGFDAATWRAMADLGWMAVSLPVEHGGLDAGQRARGVIMESIGQALVLEPYWSSAVVCADLLQRLGDPEQRERWLPLLASGSLRGALACCEPATGYAWSEVRCVANRQAAGWRLQGEKIAVLDAPWADRLMVLARTGAEDAGAGALALFWIPAHSPGLRRRDYPTVDERRCSDLLLEGVQVDAECLVGVPGEVHDGMSQVLDQATAALCHEAVGTMSRAVQATIDYLKVRRQFGRPLSQFQALRHRVADMVMALEQSRSMASLCTLALGDEPRSRERVVAAAKAQVGIAGRFIGESAVQLHGGIGVTDELQVGHFLKRLLAIDALLGDTYHQLSLVARLSFNTEQEPTPCH